MRARSSSKPYLAAVAGRLLYPPCTCNGQVATIVGTDDGETIAGSASADVIGARGGNDTIGGAGGTDVCNGGLGNDSLTGCETTVQ